MAKLKHKGGLGNSPLDNLDQILPSNDPVAPVAPANDIALIPVGQIESNPFQPRINFEEEALQELADSIRVHGIIQPLTVRKLSDNAYQLISGERRLKASKEAGLKAVPAYVRTANDEQMLEMALIENIQREDLNPIEIAQSYQRMIDELGLKQGELGDKVGKKRTTVTNYLSLLRLPAEIVTAIRSEDLSMGHAKAIKGVEDKALQISIYREIITRELSVRQAEELAKRLKAPKVEAEKKPAKKEISSHEIQLRDVEKKLEEKFGNQVVINQKENEKGQISLHFNSTKDLNRILGLMDL